MRKKILTVLVIAAIGGGVWYLFSGRTSSKSHLGGEVVATIDGQDITLQEVRSFAATIPQLSELPFEMLYPQLLDTMINAKVLLSAAEKAGIESDENIQRNIQLAKDQILSQGYLMKRLESMITPEKLQALYDEEIKSYTPQEEIRARHILVGTKQEAQDILVQLKAGADFATLANTKSLDTENKDGELGYFTKSMMIPEFGDAVFSLKKGQLSEPIKTPFGYHVVLIEDKRLAAPPAMEDVKEQLKQTFMDQNAKTVIAEERQKLNVKVLKPTLTPPAQQPAVQEAPENPEAVTEPAK